MRHSRLRAIAWLITGLALSGGSGPAWGGFEAAESDALLEEPRLRFQTWHFDYANAMNVAKAQGKKLFIYFKGPDNNRIREKFEADCLPDPRIRDLLDNYILAELPTETEITVDGKAVRVLEHAAFAEMQKSQGFAILDFTDPESETYGHVVTAVPFVRGKYYEFRPDHLKVLLALPQGTITQRTLVFAVRIHPESPASTGGAQDSMLMVEAKNHSSHQARIRLQGHHNWDSRFRRISSLLPGGLRAQEVCAESWPYESLLDAAVDCVASWRQSSGHWSAVRSKQERFAYDMRRGTNGIWYATGIFGNWR